MYNKLCDCTNSRKRRKHHNIIVRANSKIAIS